MRPLFLPLVAVFLSLLASWSGAEEKKPTRAEAQAEFDRADAALNAAWTAAKKALSEGEFATLKESQKYWLEHRDRLARSPIFTGESMPDGGDLPLDSPAYLKAAASLTDMRTDWLRGYVTRAEDAPTGVWTDSYGGVIEIVAKDGVLHFVATCVRGPSSHLGELAGVGTWNETIGWFSDKGREPDKEGETNLSFVLRDRTLELIGANTSPYHGARAYFDGLYTRTKSLSAKDQARVVSEAKKGASGQ